MKNRDYVFLSGPIKNTADGGQGWREKVYQYSRNADWYLRVFDPGDYFDYSWNDEFQVSDRQIREYYFQAIKKATVVLCNLNETAFSVGTAFEVQYACDHDVPVIGWGTEAVYPWVKDSCTVTFDELDTALEYVTCYYDFDCRGEEDL